MKSFRIRSFFYEKWLLLHDLAVPIDTKSNVNIRFVPIFPLALYINPVSNMHVAILLHLCLFHQNLELFKGSFDLIRVSANLLGSSVYCHLT